MHINFHLLSNDEMNNVPRLSY